MPTFISDPPHAVYFLLAIAGMVAGVVWFNRRTRKSLAVFLGVLVFVGIVILLDRLFESPREESVRRVMAMANAADAKDSEGFASHLADTVKYRGAAGELTLSRDQLRLASFWSLLRNNNVHVATWDFSRTDVKEIDANTIEIGFMAKGESGGKQIPMYFRTTFSKQPDGQMKLSELASFDPVKRVNERTDLGGFLK